MNILKPIETLIINLLELFYTITDNYGFSVILLSFSVTLIMFPLFLIAERIQKKEEIRKSKMQSDLDKLDDVKNKQEKYFYTKRLYKNYNYHPISSLKSLLGLFIQIPFFIAAFKSLSNFNAFENVGFLFIRDLSVPDGILWSINLLPFIMTIINIFASYLYSLDKTFKEKIQFVVIALIFLFLLYDKPSALVLYWTFNNLFGILKNLLLKKEVFYININFNRIFKKMGKRIFKNRSITDFRILFLTVQFLLLGVVFVILFLIPLISWLLIYVLILSFTITFLVFLLLKKEDNGNIFFYISFLILIFCLILSKNTDSYRKVIVMFYFFHYILIAISYYFIEIDNFINRILPNIKELRKIIKRAVLSILLVILVFNPIIIYNSSPIDFSYNLLKYLPIIIIMFVIIVFSSIKIIDLIKDKYIGYVFTLIVIFYISSILNLIFFKGDYGVLADFQFNDPKKLNDSIRYVYSILSLSISFIIFLFFVKIKFRYFYKLINIILAFFICLCLFSFISSPGKKLNVNTKNISSDIFESNISFSQTKPNVIVLFMDRFTAGLVGYVLEDNPTLAADLDGFNFYSSAISNGSSTIFGAPVMMGGGEYTVEERNKRNNETNIEKISESYSVIPNLMKNKAKFNVNVYGLPFYDEIVLKKDISSVFKHNLNSNLGSIWLSDPKNAYYSNSKSSNLQNEIFNLGVISLFNTSLPLFREKIYKDVLWGIPGRVITPPINDYAVLDYLPEISFIAEDDDSLGNFNWITNDFIHNPGGIGSNLLPSKNPKIDQKDRLRFKDHRKTILSYYNVSLFLNKLSDWIIWMKENQVYNNTRIIIASDHGSDYSVDYYFDKILIPNYVPKGFGNKFHTALLFKDFNSTGELEINDNLISQSEVPFWIVKDIIDNPINPYTGEHLVRLDPLEGLTMNYSINWKPNMNPKNTFKFQNTIGIKGKTLFDLEWYKVDQ